MLNDAQLSSEEEFDEWSALLRRHTAYRQRCSGLNWADRRRVEAQCKRWTCSWRVLDLAPPCADQPDTKGGFWRLKTIARWVEVNVLYD